MNEQDQQTREELLQEARRLLIKIWFAVWCYRLALMALGATAAGGILVLMVTTNDVLFLVLPSVIYMCGRGIPLCGKELEGIEKSRDSLKATIASSK